MRGSIGIDIGGTKLAVGAVDHGGKVMATRRAQTSGVSGFAEGIALLAGLVQEVMAEAEWTSAEVSGIGMGCPGPLDPLTGVILNPYTLPGWEGENILEALNAETGLRVRLENDADAAVLGEAWQGAGQAAGRVVMLTFGTGIGCGVLLDGRIFRGADRQHPEAGHIYVGGDGADCYCGRRGCFEAVASGSAIDRAAREAGFEDGHGFFKAAREQQEQAGEILRRLQEAVINGVWTILHTLVPERLILGGGVMEEHFSLFEEPIQAALQESTMLPRQALEVVAAQLGNQAGLIGAARLGQGQ